jgi:hypothetical protein
MSRHGCFRARGARLVLAAVGAVALVVSQVASGLPGAVTALAAGPSGRPNHFDASRATKSVNHLPAPPKAASGPPPCT